MNSKNSRGPLWRWFFAAMPILLFGLVVPAGAQQGDGSFREFDRRLVPTPEELFRSLSVFDSDGVSGLDSNSPLKSSVMKQLEQSGRDLISKMSPEQKRKAREFADKFLSENGLETEEGKALMNQLGIPSEVQDELAQQVKGWDADDKKRFSTLAEMFTQNQGRGSNETSPSRSRNRDSRGMSRTSSGDLASDSSNQVKGLGDLFKQAAENLGTDDQKQAAESTLKNILNGAKDTLARSSGDRAKPKERLTSRFDRLLVEAAKRSLEAKSKSSTNLDFPESVDSALEHVLGKVQDTIKNKRLNKNAIPPDTIPQRRNAEGEQLTRNNVNATNRDSGVSNNETGTGASVGAADVMPALGGLSKINPSRLFLVMAIAGLVGFVAYVLWQNLTGELKARKERGFGRRFRAARLRSPRDLVEAVDQVIVNNFGADSRWWNDKYAKDILCSSAPQFRASISQMLNDYVRARYTLNAVAISDDVQKQYKTTLKELSNLRPDSNLAAESANGNEG